MQQLPWYLNRLKTMSAVEIAWRVKSLGENYLDRVRVSRGIYPTLVDAGVSGISGKFTSGFTVSDLYEADWNIYGSGDTATWRQSLKKRAELILSNRLSFFNLKDHYVGKVIDWNREPAHFIKAPMDYAPAIDYRDFNITGDCKFVWEPNRHHQLVVLGRAYRATGQIQFAKKVDELIFSWMDQCPYMMGMNWRSPLELGIRLINWVWAVDLIRDSEVLSEKKFARLLHSVYLHLWEITRKYSKGSSSNNHLVGEAAGVFVACSYFDKLKNADKWRQESRDILIREIEAQTYPDGCTREQAIGYHMFVLQFFLIAGLVGKKTGREFPDSYWKRVEKMTSFLAGVQTGGENIPMFGDADDGYVLDLGGGPPCARDLLCVAAVLFDRPDFKELAPTFREYGFWLLGKDGRKRFEFVTSEQTSNRLKSLAYPEAGYYLLQAGDRKDKISLAFDCGELGYKSIAAHGHADALSFTLRAFGKDIFVDPGTYDYFSFPEWRNYFRSTRAHNTVEVDGMDQSEMLGPFMWGKRANARCIRWEPRHEGGGILAGEHDGYKRLQNPVLHRREIELDAQKHEILIEDSIITSGSHEIALYFHTSEFCHGFMAEQNHVCITLPEGTVFLETDPKLCISIFRGATNPVLGWISRGYHVKEKITTIRAFAKCGGTERFRTKIRFHSDKGIV